MASHKITQRNQPKIPRGENRDGRRVERRQNDHARYRPRNHWRNYDGGIFYINRENVGARLNFLAQLMRQHYCQRLIAGNHARDNRRDDNTQKRRELFAEPNHKILQAVQKTRRLENPRVATRNAQDSQDVRH